MLSDKLDGLTEFDIQRVFQTQETKGMDFEKMGYKYIATNNEGLEIYKKNDVIVYYRPTDHYWYSAIDKSWLR